MLEEQESLRELPFSHSRTSAAVNFFDQAAPLKVELKQANIEIQKNKSVISATANILKRAQEDIRTLTCKLVDSQNLPNSSEQLKECLDKISKLEKEKEDNSARMKKLSDQNNFLILKCEYQTFEIGNITTQNHELRNISKILTDQSADMANQIRICRTHHMNHQNASHFTELPAFSGIYKSLMTNSTDLNMSIDRTFSCESTDTASEMLYDSFDHDKFLSDVEDTCFLDDITEADITACISNEQVDSFDFIFWLKKLGGKIGKSYNGGKENELAILLGAIDYLKYLKWYKESTFEIASPLSMCSQSSIEADYSPEYGVPTDLNATFRRKLSFGDDTTISNNGLQNRNNPQVYSSEGLGNVFDPYSSINPQNWRRMYEEDSQSTLLGNRDEEGKRFTDKHEDVSDMSFADDSSDIRNKENSLSVDLNCSENANWSFMHQNCPNINNEMYASIQQMCLVQGENSCESTLNNRLTIETSSSNDGPTEEELIQYYCKQYPALSSLLTFHYSSDESDKPANRKTKQKRRTKRKTKRRSNKKTTAGSGNSKTGDHIVDSTDTQVVEADSTTTSPEKDIHQKSVQLKPSKRSSGLKRPKNGFIRFSIEYRKILAEKHPNLDNRDVSKMLGQKWRKMTAEERKPYEEEFAHDLEEMKKQNPSWKYAPHKRTGHDEIEPMPSRLRPRDKLKRKFSPYLIKTSSAKKRRISPRIKKTGGKGAIMKCTICSKYQQIYGVPAKNIQNLQSLWFCGLNPDPNNSTCFQKSASATKNLISLSETATIKTSGPFTSVVSRSCNSAAAKPQYKPLNESSSVRSSYLSKQTTSSPGLTSALVSNSSPAQKKKNYCHFNNSRFRSGRKSVVVSPYLNEENGKKASVGSSPVTSTLNSSDLPISLTPSKIIGRTVLPFHEQCPERRSQISNCKTSVASTLTTPISNTIGIQPILSLVPPTTMQMSVVPNLESGLGCSQIGPETQNILSNFNAFISFLPASVSVDTGTQEGHTTSLPTSTVIPESSRAINASFGRSITTAARTNTFPAGAYITVIPKSLWYSLSQRKP
ncbi:unnamed protein product [Mytilus coruscus]|uniref:Sex-determining region Y protein n=1 Tax=Mytilus coruscus TaxID=42192 RepID=A0A6J8BMF1_MYTCO|nr:unnamed protein product [Mytilus coruscus]